MKPQKTKNKEKGATQTASPSAQVEETKVSGTAAGLSSETEKGAHGPSQTGKTSGHSNEGGVEVGADSLNLSGLDRMTEDAASVASEASGMTGTSAVSGRSEMAKINSTLNSLGLQGGFVKLSAAEKRVFKRALGQGHSRESAIDLAKMSIAQRNGCERQLSTPALPPKENAKRLKKSYSKVASTIRLGITPADLTKQPFTPEQMAQVQEAVMDVLIDLIGKGCRPTFEGCLRRSGWLIFSCTSAETAEWMRTNFALIKAKCTFDMRLVEESSFPKAHIIRGFFPQSASLSNEKVLKFVEGQNGFNISTWKVIQRSIEGNSLHLVIATDDISLERLVALKRKIYYRYGSVRLILKDQQAKPASTASDKQVDASSGNAQPPPIPGQILDDERPTTSKAAAETERRKTPLLTTVGKEACRPANVEQKKAPAADSKNASLQRSFRVAGSRPTTPGTIAGSRTGGSVPRSSLHSNPRPSKGPRGAQRQQLVSASMRPP